MKFLPFLILSVAASPFIRRHGDPEGRKPIVLSSSGGFEIGGKVLVNPANPNQTLSCDHGYVEFVPTPQA
jgi:hypothetical protein